MEGDDLSTVASKPLHQTACKNFCCLSANLLFIAAQIVYNGLITAWATENHSALKGERNHAVTRGTQVNGNRSRRCHGKCLSRCPGPVPYGWRRHGKGGGEKNLVTGGSGGWKKTCQKTCCNLDDQMFALCSSARHRIHFPHLMNNSTESNWSGQSKSQLKIDIFHGTFTTSQWSS